MHPSEKQKLNRELDQLHDYLNDQIAVLQEVAIQQEMDVHKMMTADGKHVLTPLLVAKAQCLNAKVHLNVKE